MSLTIQFYTMLSMAAMGVWLGAAIDTYHRFSKRRRMLFHWLEFINDVLFWLIQGLILFYVLLQVNQGEIRFYIFLAILCGYAAYQALFRQVYQKLLERGIQFVLALYRFGRKMIHIFFVSPIKWLLNLLYRLCMMIISAVLSIFYFLLNLIWKPIFWGLKVVYRLLGIQKLINKIQSKTFFQKGKGFWKKLWKWIQKE